MVKVIVVSIYRYRISKIEMPCLHFDNMIQLRYCCYIFRGVRATKALLLLVLGSIVFLLLPAAVFSSVEGWTYGEAVYYAFVTLSTIGFGDFISGRVFGLFEY